VIGAVRKGVCKLRLEGCYGAAQVVAEAEPAVVASIRLCFCEGYYCVDGGEACCCRATVVFVVVQVVDGLTAPVTVTVEDKAGASLAGAKDSAQPVTTSTNVLLSKLWAVEGTGGTVAASRAHGEGASGSAAVSAEANGCTEAKCYI